MTSLPEDLIISILVKLQVKPLMRFRCVCKWWYHLIKSPHFIEMHQRSTENELILIKHIRKEDDTTVLSFHSYETLNEIPPPMEVPHFNDNNRFGISWPCNGLLLCVSISNANNHKSVSVLCNPATRESKLLPPNPFHVRKHRLWGNLFGLGFDSNQKDYKVITIEYRDKAHIYNMSTNCWRQIEHVMPDHNLDSGVPFNGALHWLASRNGIKIILSFDVITEVFQDINLPEFKANDRQNTAKTVTLLNECLAMFTFDCEYTTFVDIWVMKVGSWTKHMRIGPLLVDHNFIVLHMVWKNEAILWNDCGHGHEKLKLLALDTHEFTDTVISLYDRRPSVMVFKESLVSIN